MLNQHLLKQFREFYFKNYPQDMETQISYFAVFGGMDWQIDTTKNINTLIESHIFNNFDTLNDHINRLTLNNLKYKKLLKALAIGNRKIFSAFNKAGLNNANGGEALKYLQEKGIVFLEYSREKHPRELHPNKKLKKRESRYRISHKVLFKDPFIRFWFYFIEPNISEIKTKNYAKVLKEFELKRSSYTSLIYEELSEILLNYHLRDSNIVSSGSYWDAKNEIDILTITDKGHIYIAECKWTNHKINKKELHKLNEKCKNIGIIPTQIIFFSKRGFSKELQQMCGSKIALYSSNSFESLVKNQSKKRDTNDFIN